MHQGWRCITYKILWSSTWWTLNKMKRGWMCGVPKGHLYSVFLKLIITEEIEGRIQRGKFFSLDSGGTLRLKCFSCDSDNCPNVGIGPLLQFPHPPRVGPALLTLPFSPLVSSSYQVLRGSMYSFPLVRYSCLHSAGVLHALPCLRVYSWGIRGERCIPHPPTPLPSCQSMI